MFKQIKKIKKTNNSIVTVTTAGLMGHKETII